MPPERLLAVGTVESTLKQRTRTVTVTNATSTISSSLLSNAFTSSSGHIESQLQTSLPSEIDRLAAAIIKGTFFFAHTCSENWAGLRRLVLVRFRRVKPDCNIFEQQQTTFNKLIRIIQSKIRLLYTVKNEIKWRLKCVSLLITRCGVAWYIVLGQCPWLSFGLCNNRDIIINYDWKNCHWLSPEVPWMSLTNY